jgi:fructose-1,6-bisphosphatase II / sedoheptulose-1,7-bisphosphatase
MISLTARARLQLGRVAIRSVYVINAVSAVRLSAATGAENSSSVNMIAILDIATLLAYRAFQISAITGFSNPMVSPSKILDRVLVLEMVRVTEAAAIGASKLIGRGDEKAADAAAVEAMRAALNELAMDGTVVIGEGERDEAPMLFIGEKVGSAIGTGPKIDIALDPLEGTTITAKAGPNALAVLAVAEQGNLLNAPDVYMDKLAVGPGYPEGVIDLNKSATENVAAVAAAKGVAPNEIIVCVLDRPRHEKLIAELRGIGCGIMLIPDGDVAGVIATTNPDTTIDMYMGSGGAPEGVLAAAALRCVGGQFKGRLLFRNEDEKARARKWGIKDLDYIYDLSELAKGDCIFAATGVTDGSLLDGVKVLRDGKMTTHTVVMRASSGTVRWVRGEHRKQA